MIMIIFSLVSIVIVGLNAVVAQNNETSENSLRLVGGSTRYEGRVEIYHEGEWGSICDIHLLYDEGKVICRELGYRGVDEVFSDAYFGEGPGTIWLGGFYCTGYEDELLECYSYPHWGFPNCGHSQDIGVRCLAAGFTFGDVRLLGGAGIHEGFVEIHHWWDWVASSYAHFGYNEALVVCKQLGFSDGVVEYYGKDAPFDISEEHPGDVKVWTDTLDCDGSESRLTDCHDRFIRLTSYQPADQLNGVVCNVNESSNYNGKIRLVGGDDASHGRLEIYLDNQWGTICNDDISYNEAYVVCRSLGFQDVDECGEEDVPPGSGNINVYLDDLNCGGSESSIVYCDVHQLHNFNCAHSGDIVVRCTKYPAHYVQVGHLAGIAVGAIVGIFLLVFCCVKMCKKSSVSSGHTSTRVPANQITPHQTTDVREAGQTPPSYNHHGNTYNNPQGSHLQPSQPVFDPAGSHIPQSYTASYPTPPSQGVNPLVTAHDPGNGGGYSPGYSYTPALGTPAPGFSSPESPGIQGNIAVHHAPLTHHDTSIHYPPVPHLAQPAAVPQIYTIT